MLASKPRDVPCTWTIWNSLKVICNHHIIFGTSGYHYCYIQEFTFVWQNSATSNNTENNQIDEEQWYSSTTVNREMQRNLSTTYFTIRRFNTQRSTCSIQRLFTASWMHLTYNRLKLRYGVTIIHQSLSLSPSKPQLLITKQMSISDYQINKPMPPDCTYWSWQDRLIILHGIDVKLVVNFMIFCIICVTIKETNRCHLIQGHWSWQDRFDYSPL